MTGWVNELCIVITSHGFLCRISWVHASSCRIQKSNVGTPAQQWKLALRLHSSVLERWAHWKLLWERGRECQEKPIPVLRALQQCQDASEGALAGTGGSWDGPMQRSAWGIFSAGVQGFCLAGYQFCSAVRYHHLLPSSVTLEYKRSASISVPCFRPSPYRWDKTSKGPLTPTCCLTETLWERDPFTIPQGQ